MAERGKVIVSRYAGFCPGVKGVLKKIDMALSEGNRPVFTFGQPINNPGVVREYEKKGVAVIRSASEAPEGATVIIRAHGLPLPDLEELKSRNINLVEGTCHKVSKVHKLIFEAAGAGRHIIVAGYSRHAETIAHASFFPRITTVISSAGDVEELSLPDKPVTLLAQTTFDSAEFVKIRIALEEKNAVLHAANTICSCTIRAQEDAAKIAARSDATIVIGGRESSNTLRLVDCCRRVCPFVFHVESPEELDPAKLAKFNTIGITAGASTPPGDVERIAALLAGKSQDS